MIQQKELQHPLRNTTSTSQMMKNKTNFFYKLYASTVRSSITVINRLLRLVKWQSNSLSSLYILIYTTLITNKIILNRITTLKSLFYEKKIIFFSVLGIFCIISLQLVSKLVKETLSVDFSYVKRYNKSFSPRFRCNILLLNTFFSL